MMKIEVRNKPVSDKVRAEMRGDLSKDVIDKKISEIGYSKLANYEKEFVKNSLDNPTDDKILAYCKEAKTLYFKNLCEEKIIEGFVSINGHTYRTNRDDQTNMIGQKDALIEDPLITSVLWKTEDVGYISHTREEWLNVYQEAFTHKQKQLFKYDDLKKKVSSTLTHAELDMIKW